MKKGLLAIALCAILFMMGCGEAKQSPVYMGGHYWGDTQAEVEKAGNVTEVLGLPVQSWIYLYNAGDMTLKGIIYNTGDDVTLDQTLSAFSAVYGEYSSKERGDKYMEYSWVDGTTATIYIIENIEEKENLVVQIEMVKDHR